MSTIYTLENGDKRIDAKPAGGGSGKIDNSYVEKNTNYPRASHLTNLSKSVQSKPLTTSSKKEAVIDVVNNFDWTSTPVHNNNFPVIPPSISLVEHEITKGALATQLEYSALATFESVGVAAGELASLLTKHLGQETLAKFLKGAEGVINDIGGGSNGNQWMSPYAGLYNTKKTNFIYKLPYFSNTYRSAPNLWGDTYSGDGKNQFIDAVTNFIPAATNMGLGMQGFYQPGVFIEKTKYYQFSSQGEAFNFSFPLINTLNPESVANNFQLLFLLIYQNRPYRRSRSLIDPSHLYEIKIPGTRYVKWGVIDTLAVDFVGTRREMEIEVPMPGGGLGKIKSIVPEAYMVNISMSSLTTETGNFMLELLQKGGNI